MQASSLTFFNCELLFSLPFSNGHVERMFSAMKIIKTNRRSNLKSRTLSDFLDIKAGGPPLAGFNADQGVSLWWDTCKTTRMVSQMLRKEYQPREKGQSSSSSNIVEAPESDSQDTIILEDWDDWFRPSIPLQLWSQFLGQLIGTTITMYPILLSLT